MSLKWNDEVYEAQYTSLCDFLLEVAVTLEMSADEQKAEKMKKRFIRLAEEARNFQKVVDW